MQYIAIPKLTARGLQINENKTEEYHIAKDGTSEWKKCKILGSLLDTEQDIHRRKLLAHNSMQKLKYIYTNNKLANKIKIRIFNACTESIFLYNSELWTASKKIENKIDSFHRRLLRKAINIKWPKKISNEKLYRITQQEKWSDKIRSRRLRWYGHAERLPEESPAKIALEEARRKVKKNRGGQQITWLAIIEKDLKKLNITPEDARKYVKDRIEWRKIVRRAEAPCAQARSAS